MTKLKNKSLGLTSNQLLFALSAFYFLFRLINLRILPIFNDEATYVDWGWKMVNIKGQMFYSIVHAKTPLLMWIFGYSQKVFSDPLLAGRFVSVVTGFAAAIGLFAVAKKVFDEKTAILAFILYTLNPLFMLFDRQALMESSITAVGVWTLYFFLKIQKEQDYKNPIVAGVLLGVGYFIKSNAFTFAISLFVLSFYLFFKKEKEGKERFDVNVALVFSTAFIVLLPLIMNSTFWQTISQNQKYILTPQEIIRFPISTWINNIAGTFSLLVVYINPVVVATSIYAIYIVFKKRNKYAVLLVGWLLIGLFVANLLAIDTTMRYIVSFLPLFTVLGSYGLMRLFEKNKTILYLVALLVLPTFILSVLQIINPIDYFNNIERISARYSNKSDYVTSWPSGYGVDKAIEYIKNESKKSRLVVAVRADAGNPENSVFAYFNGSKKVLPTFMEARMFNFDTNRIECLEASLPLYYVSRDDNLAGLNKYFEEQKRFFKPENKHFVGVYKLKTECEGDSVKLF